MTPNHDPLERALESLRSRGATLDDSFSRQLESRLMREFSDRTQAKGRRARRAAWVALVAVGVLAAGAAGYGYAASRGFHFWTLSFQLEDDGIVTDADGRPIGFAAEDKDGSPVTVVTMPGGWIEIKGDQVPAGQPISVIVEEDR